MTTLQQAEALRKQAITLLLSERNAIDDKLRQLGHHDAQDAADPSNITRRNNCKHCGEPGHNTRRCPKRSSQEAAVLNLDPQ